MRIAAARRLLAAIALALAALPALALPDARYGCGGAVEHEVWALWDGGARELIRSAVVDDVLGKRGDTYALYDLQQYLHNLVDMAARCGRVERLEELSRLVGSTYAQLAETRQGGAGWICRGARACLAANRGADGEVQLTSSQFLALALRVASALDHAPSGSPQSRAFVGKTADIARAHLLRWSRGADPLRIGERLAMSPAAVRDGASRQFFTDVDLWIIAAHAELAGLRGAGDSSAAPPLKHSLIGLLRLLKARTTTATVAAGPQRRVVVAELDRGYWRFHPDSRYAGYAGADKPLSCGPGPRRVLVDPASVSVVESVGWDFSHAHRLVHAMDAIDRNRDALRRVSGVPAELLPPPERTAQFAAQLVTSVWNGDAEWPLFANYWDGSNGWYRVDYRDGRRDCHEGYPPSGLSFAFATGGFAAWGRHEPALYRLAERIDALSRSKDPADSAFIEARYPGLGSGGAASTRTLTRLMFWPSLVRASTDKKA